MYPMMLRPLINSISPSWRIALPTMFLSGARSRSLLLRLQWLAGRAVDDFCCPPEREQLLHTFGTNHILDPQQHRVSTRWFPTLDFCAIVDQFGVVHAQSILAFDFALKKGAHLAGFSASVHAPRRRKKLGNCTGSAQQKVLEGRVEVVKVVLGDLYVEEASHQASDIVDPELVAGFSSRYKFAYKSFWQAKDALRRHRHDTKLDRWAVAMQFGWKISSLEPNAPKVDALPCVRLDPSGKEAHPEEEWQHTIRDFYKDIFGSAGHERDQMLSTLHGLEQVVVGTSIQPISLSQFRDAALSGKPVKALGDSGILVHVYYAVFDGQVELLCSLLSSRMQDVGLAPFDSSRTRSSLIPNVAMCYSGFIF